ncbi:MAG: hypothetical protein PHW25_00555 [Zoogloea sp.]|uniref:hypothetical protein n=1 Tax=Zoogloea sp. TaxID=49181 RepID=UPI00262DA8AA|nr:hypothetical protein [Zoogloea sp.]MDD3325559.1 hypothetical protein [Zoogloea sp.]
MRCIEERRSDVQRLLNEASTARLWWPYEPRVTKAAGCFDQACEVLAAHPSGHGDGRPATIARALGALPGVRHSVFQYQADYGSVLMSARRFWREADELQDYELLALFALNESLGALSDFVRLLAQFDRSADAEGIGRRDDLKEAAHRNEWATWEREESGYAHRHLTRALEILADAKLAAALWAYNPDPKTVKSEEAKKAAAKRHEETNRLKAEALAIWTEKADPSWSNERAAKLLEAYIPLQRRTLSGYVAEFKKRQA